MSSQKQKQIADRDSNIHEEMIKMDLFAKVKSLVNTVSHDCKSSNSTLDDNPSLEAIRLHLLGQQKIEHTKGTDLENITFLTSEFFDIFSFLRCWHPYRKSPIEQHNLFHIPSSYARLFWKIEPDTTSSLDFLLFLQGESETSDHGAKCVDLIISLLKCTYKRKSIDLLNWQAHLKQWLIHINNNSYANLTNDSPFQSLPASKSLTQLRSALSDFKEFKPPPFHVYQQYQQYRPVSAAPVHPQGQVMYQQQQTQHFRKSAMENGQQIRQQLHNGHMVPQVMQQGDQQSIQGNMSTIRPTKQQVAEFDDPPPSNESATNSFSFFQCQFQLRCLILSVLVENAFSSHFEYYKNASDKYHAEYMRFEPIWTPSISSINECGEFYWLYDECLWYRTPIDTSDPLRCSDDSKWYLLAYTIEDWEALLANPLISEHPTIYPALSKCFSNFKDDFESHLELLSKHASNTISFSNDELLFSTHRCLQLAELNISDQLHVEQLKRQDLINKQQRQIVELNRIQHESLLKLKQDQVDKEQLFIQELKQLQLKPSFYSRSSVGVNLADGNTEFIDINDLQFSTPLSEIKCDLPLFYSLLSICKSLLASPHGWPFEEPVDPVELELPDYFDIIKEPMDLSTIYNKILNRSYSNAEEFHSDVCLMFNNAHTYNEIDSDIVDVTHELELQYCQLLIEFKFPLNYEQLIVPRKRKRLHRQDEMDIMSDVDVELLANIDEEIEQMPVKKRKKDESSEEFDIASTNSNQESSSVSSLMEIHESSDEEVAQIKQYKKPVQQQQQQQSSDVVLAQTAYVQAYLRCLYDYVDALSKDSNKGDAVVDQYLQMQKTHYAETWQRAKQQGQLEVKINTQMYQHHMIRVVGQFQHKIEPKWIKYLQPQIDKVAQFQEKYKMQMMEQQRRAQQSQQIIIQQQQQQMMYMQQYPPPQQQQQQMKYYYGQQGMVPTLPVHQKVQPQSGPQPGPQLGFGQQHSISPSKVLGSFDENKKTEDNSAVNE
eukprot:NODE_200_length_15202_cov_0.356618.p1 type:complete len:999 gc:universal NODE_200_length_15202_cov_0.356618:8272-5276(-)